MVVQDAVTMGELLRDVAAGDPISALLLAVGHVLLIFSIGVFGVLSIGAVASTIRPH